MDAPQQKDADTRPDASPIRLGRLKRDRAFLLLLAALTAFVVAGHFRAYAVRGFVPGDFGAFYCAGKVVLQHRDPYRVQPLLDCERRIGMVIKSATVPAPLPGYDFLPLAALAGLPTRVAVLIVGAFLLGATAVTAYALARLSPLPPIVAFAVAFMAITYAASGLGQISPLTAAAVAMAALLLRVGRQRTAALVASAALIQPHLGVPVLAASFLFVPRTRLVIGAAVSALLLFAVGTVGLRGMLEYPTVLSTHARSEVNASIQYSFTWLLHALGASTGIALLLGVLSYLLLIGICMLVLARNKERAIKTGAVILLPAAFSVFGGTYMHHHEMGVALLAAVVLVRPTPALLSPLLPAALLSVSFWSTQYSTRAALPALLLALVVACCVVFFPVRALGTRAASRATLFAAILIIGYTTLLLAIRPAPGTRPDTTIDVVREANIVHDPSAFASEEAIRLDDAEAKVDPLPLSYYLLLKLPTWFGAGATLVLSSLMLLSGEPRARTRRWSAPVAEATCSAS